MNIKAVRRIAEDGRRRVFYAITDEGRKLLQQQKMEYRLCVMSVDSLLDRETGSSV